MFRHKLDSANSPSLSICLDNSMEKVVEEEEEEIGHLCLSYTSWPLFQFAFPGL